MPTLCPAGAKEILVAEKGYFCRFHFHRVMAKKKDKREKKEKKVKKVKKSKGGSSKSTKSAESTGAAPPPVHVYTQSPAAAWASHTSGAAAAIQAMATGTSVDFQRGRMIEIEARRQAGLYGIGAPLTGLDCLRQMVRLFLFLLSALLSAPAVLKRDLI